jgi:general secretion pathway protein A
MTLEFYKLKEQPFGSAPDARFLFLSATHRDAFGALLQALQAGRGLVTLIAPAGLGKTSLLFHTLNSFGDRVVTVYLFRAAQTPADLLKAILADMGASAAGDDPDDMVLRLTELLSEQHRLGRRVVVILDEAHDLSSPVLELVKTLSRLEASRGKLVQIVLCGRPELADELVSTKGAQSAQRLSPAVHLEPLPAEDTRQYVDHRLRTAGYDRETPLFTAEAGSLIARYSRGIPRAINNICLQCLSLGYEKKRERIEGDIVREVAGELQLALPSALMPLVLAKENPVQVRPQALPVQSAAAAVRPRSMFPQVAAAGEVVAFATEQSAVTGRPQPDLPRRAAETIPNLRLSQTLLSPMVAAQQVPDFKGPILGQPVSSAQPLVVGAQPPLLSEAPATESLILELPTHWFPAQVSDPPQVVLPEVGEKNELSFDVAPVAFSPRDDVPADLPVPSRLAVIDKLVVAALPLAVLPAMPAKDIPIFKERAFTEMPVAAVPSDSPTLSVEVTPQPDSLEMEAKRNPVSSFSQLLVTPLIEVKRNQDSGPLESVVAEMALPQDAVASTLSTVAEDEVAPGFVVHAFPRLAIAVIFLLTVSGSMVAVYRVTTAHHGFAGGKALPDAHSSLPSLRQPIAAVPPAPLAEVHSPPVTASGLASAGHDLKGMDLSSALRALSGRSRSLSHICTINFGTCDSKHLNELRKVNPRLKDPD